MSNVDGYVVAFRKTVPSTSEYHKCVIQDNTVLSHYKESLQSDTTYQVKIAAYNTFGCGEFTLPKLFVFQGLLFSFLRYRLECVVQWTNVEGVVK